MHILFDARSVRTPAAVSVLRGLTGGWVKDPRVTRVSVSLPPGIDIGSQPGIDMVVGPARPWPLHVLVDLPKIARTIRADVIFVPNGLPPRDPRAVVYFQDLHHFRDPDVHSQRLHRRMRRSARRAWWAYAMPACGLAVAVSRGLEAEVQLRFQITVVMVPNGVEVGGVRWTGSEPTVFVMGGTGVRKGEDVALHAWARLPFAVRAGTMLVVGGVEPARRREQLTSLARALGIEEESRVLGNLT